MLAFAIGMGAASWRSYTLDRARIRTEAASEAARAAHAADAFVSGEIQGLQAIAATPTIQSGDRKAILAMFTAPSVRALGPGGLSWVAADGRLAVLTGTKPADLPSLSRFDFSNRPAERAVLANGAPAYVGAAVIGVAIHAPLLSVAVPTHDASGALSGVLGAVFTLDQRTLAQLFNGNEVVLDISDQVIWDRGPITRIRVAPTAAAVGTLRERHNGNRSDVVGVSGRHGQLVGFATVLRSSWLVTVERPWSAAIGSARDRLIAEWSAIAAAALIVAGITMVSLRRSSAAHRMVLERAERDEMLAAATAAIAAAPELRSAAAELAEHAARALGAEVGVVFLASPDRRRLRLAASVGLEPETVARMREIPLDAESLVASAIVEQRTIVVAGRAALERTNPVTAARFPDASSCIVVPLVDSGAAQGSLGVMFDAERVVTHDHIALLETLAALSAAAIGRARQADLVRERDAHAALAAAATGVGSWTWERESGEVWWSPAAYEVFGVDREAPDFMAQWRARMSADDLDRVRAMLAECAEAGRAILSYRYDHPDGERWMRLHATLVRGGAAIAGTVYDGTDEVLGEAAAHAEADAAAQLAAAARTEDVADVAVNAGGARFGAAASLVVLHVDGEARLDVLATNGWERIEGSSQRELASRPAGDALRDGIGRFYESAEEIDGHYPTLSSTRRAEGVEAIACLPLLAGGDVLGALELCWRRPMPLPPAMRDNMATFASKVAQALARARLVDHHVEDARRAQHLGILAADLAQATDTDQIAEATAQACAMVLGVQTASVIEAEVHGRHTVHLGGQAGPVSRRRWHTISAQIESHPRRAFTTAEWQLHLSPEEITNAFPKVAGEFTALGVGAMVSVPLIESGVVHGVLTLTWAQPHRPSAEERNWIGTVANTVSQALHRMRLARHADTARRHAEVLARLAVSIADLREPRELARTVAEEVRRTSDADRVSVFELDEGRTTLVRVAAAGSEDLSVLSPITLNSGHPAARAVRARQPEFVATRRELERDDPEAAAAFPDTASLATVPMLAHGQLVGVLMLLYVESHEFDTEERAHVTAIAAHTALALERARLFHEQRDLAESLQRSMLPGTLVAPPGVSAAGGYLPGTEGMLIGGDWYDIVTRDDGSALVVVGDVAGHGREAAIIMGRLRTLVNANPNLEPGGLLEVLHDQCARDRTMATCAVVLLDPITGRARAANAGHLPFVIVSPEGSAELLHVPPGLPLGVNVTTYPTHELELPAGSLLIGYTDGLVERRDESLTESMRRLVDECAAFADLTPEQVRAALLDRLDPAARGDDTVVLVVRLAPLHAPLRVTLPATAHAARSARELLKRWLAEQHVPDDATGDLLVAAGEAVANAITHAYPAGHNGPIHVSATAGDDAVVVQVSDEGRWRPARDERGMGLRLIDLLGGGEVAHTADGTTVSIRYARVAPSESRT